MWIADELQEFLDLELESSMDYETCTHPRYLSMAFCVPRVHFVAVPHTIRWFLGGDVDHSLSNDLTI